MFYTTKLRPYVSKADGHTHIILLSDPGHNFVGSVIKLKADKMFMGTYRVVSTHKIALNKLNTLSTDTFHPAYREQAMLWRAVETAMGTGLSGDFVIYLVTLCDPAVPVEAPIVIPVTQTSIPADEDTHKVTEYTEDIADTPSIFDEDPPETFEKIRRRAKPSWDD